MVSFVKTNVGFVGANLALVVSAAVLIALSFSGPGSICLFGQTAARPNGNPGVCALASAMGFLSFALPFVVVCAAAYFANPRTQVWKLYFRAMAGVYGGVAILWCLTSVLVTGYLVQTCKNVTNCTAAKGYDVASWVIAFCWINCVLWFFAAATCLYRDRYSGGLQMIEEETHKPVKLVENMSEAEIREEVYSRYGLDKNGAPPPTEFIKRHPVVLISHLLVLALAIVLIGLSFGGPTHCFYGRTADRPDVGIGGVCGFITTTGFLAMLLAFIVVLYSVRVAETNYFILTREFYKWSTGSTFCMFLLWVIASVVVSASLSVTCKNVPACETMTGYHAAGWTLAFAWVNTAAWGVLFLRYAIVLASSTEQSKADEIAEEVDLKKSIEGEIRRIMEQGRQMRMRRDFEASLRFEERLRYEPPRSRAGTDLRITLPPQSTDHFLVAPDLSPTQSSFPTPRAAALYDEAEAVRREEEARARLFREDQDRAARIAREDLERQQRIAQEELLRAQRYEEEDRIRRARFAEEDNQRRAQLEADRVKAETLKKKIDEAERQLTARPQAAPSLIPAPLTPSERIKQDKAEAERRKEEAARLEAKRKAEAAQRAGADQLRLAEEELRREQARLEAQKLASDEETNLTPPSPSPRNSAQASMNSRILNIPRVTQAVLSQVRPQIENEYKVGMKLVNTTEESQCLVGGPDQAKVDEAMKRVEEIINEEIRRQFGQNVEADEIPEYLAWLTAKRANQAVTLSKIYDQFPHVLHIKRVFDGADNADGGGRGYLDRQQFVGSFEALFTACKKGQGVEFGTYLYDLLIALGGGDAEGITWKEFIFYCLSRRLIVLKKEKKR